MAAVPDYNNYLKALESKKIESVPSTTYNTKRNTTPSGFMEFKARDEAAQAKYDALSPAWEGIESSEKAIARGDYDLDRAEKNRAELRKEVPKLDFTKSGGQPATSSCVVS